MRPTTLIFIFSFTVVIACNKQKTKQEFIKVDSDSLIINIDKYCNSNVETEGIIVHVCSVDGKKMKLETNTGEVIKIVSQDPLISFSDSFYKKRILVRGQVKETRLDISYISEKEKERALLCHIDGTPCKDTAWVNGQISAGIADSLSNSDVERLRAEMQRKKKDYVSVVSIIAVECIEKE